MQFPKAKEIIRTLINLGSKLNTITPAYTKQLSFQTQKTDVRFQKIDGSWLKTYGMVIIAF